MTDRAMLDIETLGTDPGAAIVSIGGVRFTLADGVEATFFESVSLVDCQAHGLRIDAETLDWWLDQPAAAREQLDGGCAVGEALAGLTDFVADATEVWANSPRFDCALLRAAYDAVDRDCPWQYWDERDYRTLRETLDSWPAHEQNGTEHNALDDARYQAQCLVRALEGQQ